MRRHRCVAPPNAPFCDGNVLVGSQVPGTCVGDGECVYTTLRQDCGDPVCFGGACVDADCQFLTCDEPPEDTCEGNVAAVQYPRLGTCDEQTVECNYEAQRTDCEEQGDACVDGACVSLCAGVVCNLPPANICEGEVSVSYAEVGDCSAGLCTYEETRQDCASLGLPCIDGLCQLACDDAACVSPPNDTCSEDNTEIIFYERAGACDDTDTCVYPESGRVDCAASEKVCVNAECVPDPACEGVTCDVPPAPACEATSPSSSCRATAPSAPATSGGSRPTARSPGRSATEGPARTSATSRSATSLRTPTVRATPRSPTP